MPGRLEEIENMLTPALGSALLRRSPELIYTVNAQLVRLRRTEDSPSVLWRRLESALVNAVYLATERSMVVQLDDGRRVRVTSDALRDLADRLLALAYRHMDADEALQSVLFDLAREGSFAAMRELLSRFPLEDFDRAWITQVLEENGQFR